MNSLTRVSQLCLVTHFEVQENHETLSAQQEMQGHQARPELH